jgi:hypothetical protein
VDPYGMCTRRKPESSPMMKTNSRHQAVIPWPASIHELFRILVKKTKQVAEQDVKKKNIYKAPLRTCNLNKKISRSRRYKNV